MSVDRRTHVTSRTGLYRVNPGESDGPHGLRTGGWQLFAGRLAGLIHAGRERSFVELVALVDGEIAHFCLLGLARRERTQRRAAEESHFGVLRKAMDAEEPALA